MKDESKTNERRIFSLEKGMEKEQAYYVFIH